MNRRAGAIELAEELHAVTDVKLGHEFPQLAFVVSITFACLTAYNLEIKIQ